MKDQRSVAQQQVENDIANKIYNPMNDVLFKFIFGKDERKNITIDLLNAILNRTGKQAIKDIQFKNSEIVPYYEDDKLTRLDIFCITEDETKIDVEVQLINKKDMERRSLFYWSQMYLMGLNKGDDYITLNPAITINILGHKIFPNEPLHSMYSIYNIETGRRLNEDLELHFLEIPKFQKKPIGEMTRMERWLAYFSNKLDTEEMEELVMSDATIKKAVNDTDIFMMDFEERLKYINRQMAIMDYNTDMRVSREEGREEMANNIALAMLKKNEPIEKIAEYTGLTTERIQELAKEI
ncbi:Rpn family recombination-promoting nuclease/putative transposase [Anaerovibrio lipolyticus]|uniref:Rpn family recombination-promoting nuclease/putative transposase n=1 Tax=Anaerovibrio lipolyticus TaxID=82374 RepID=UPI0004865994|nr:Rpn family recombination-promoting nuclease/putative transposase [Anaerovibrio lipolyticus]